MMTKRYWLFGTKERVPEFEPYLRGMAKTTNRGVPIYVYASTEKRRIVTPRQRIAPLMIPHLGPDDDLGERLSILPITYPQFAAIRSQYMNHNIRPGRPDMSYVVLCDGVIIGAFAIQCADGAMDMNTYLPTPHVFLLSDFPVANTKYARLAKLVLYAALSREAQLLYERVERRRVRSMVTVAYTDNPVSMKYRGLFRLLIRKEAGNKSPHKWELVYGAEMGKWTLAEGFEEWKKRHGITRDTTTAHSTLSS